MSDFVKNALTCRVPQMLHMRILTLLVLGTLLSSAPGIARAQQAAAAPAVAVADSDLFLMQIPPLQVLIDSAIARAPGIRAQDITIRRSRVEMKHAKNNWTSDIINAGGILNYGKLNDMYLSSNSGTSGQVAATTSSQTRYSVGVSVKIPISSLIDRTDYKAAQIQVELTENQRRIIIEEIRERVYTRYNAMLAAYQAYRILYSDFGDQEMIVQHAERDFVGNLISLADLSNVRISFSKAKIDLEMARLEFKRSLWMLEELTGIRIATKN